MSAEPVELAGDHKPDVELLPLAPVPGLRGNIKLGDCPFPERADLLMYFF